MNRFCPHQGGDLVQGWVEEDRYLVCARHGWRFDLLKGGRADTSSDTIDAIELEDSLRRGLPPERVTRRESFGVAGYRISAGPGSRGCGLHRIASVSTFDRGRS